MPQELRPLQGQGQGQGQGAPRAEGVEGLLGEKKQSHQEEEISRNHRYSLLQLWRQWTRKVQKAEAESQELTGKRKVL